MRRQWWSVSLSLVAVAALGYAIARPRGTATENGGAAAARETAALEIREPSARHLEQVTEAILRGRPMPKAFAPDHPDPSGDDAEACREARRGNFDRAMQRAASRAMKALLKERKRPAACPDFIPQLSPVQP